MTDMALDTRSGEIVETEAPEAANTATEEKPAKAPKVVAEPKRCACSEFEVGDGTDDGTYTTGCEQTTGRTFAQGHDARLVSFLVDAEWDGYPIRKLVEGAQPTTFTGAEAAAGSISEALRQKAAKALANRQAKREEKDAKAKEREAAKAAKAQEKEAAKAAKAKEKEEAKAAAKSEDAPKDVPVKVEEHAGPARIKVGRREFDAMIGEDGSAVYTDASNVEQKIERDGYRLLSNA